MGWQDKDKLLKVKSNRPSKYSEEVRFRIIELCVKGFNDYQIAVEVGVHLNTIDYWRNKHDGLKEQMDSIRLRVKKNKLINALERSSSGYREDEVKTEYVETDEVTGKVTKVTRTRKYYPPNANVLKLMTNKYFPDEYNDKLVKEENTTIKVITARDRSLTLEERLAIIKRDGDIELSQDAYRTEASDKRHKQITKQKYNRELAKIADETVAEYSTKDSSDSEDK